MTQEAGWPTSAMWDEARRRYPGSDRDSALLREAFVAGMLEQQRRNLMPG